MILYALYRLGVFIVPLLPLRFCYAVANAIGEAVCLIKRKDRAAVMKNLAVVTAGSLGTKELRRLTRGVFRNFAKYLVDFFRFEKIDKQYVDESVTIEGIEHLNEAHARGKGVIVLSAHMGNWELGAAVFSIMGYPLSAVVLTHENKRINDFFTSQRRSASMEPIEIGASLKACYRVLKHNGFLALLGDRDFTKNGLPVDFFG